MTERLSHKTCGRRFFAYIYMRKNDKTPQRLILTALRGFLFTFFVVLSLSQFAWRSTKR